MKPDSPLPRRVLPQVIKRFHNIIQIPSVDMYFFQLTCVFLCWPVICPDRNAVINATLRNAQKNRLRGYAKSVFSFILRYCYYLPFGERSQLMGHTGKHGFRMSCRSPNRFILKKKPDCCTPYRPKYSGPAGRFLLRLPYPATPYLFNHQDPYDGNIIVHSPALANRGRHQARPH